MEMCQYTDGLDLLCWILFMNIYVHSSFSGYVIIIDLKTQFKAKVRIINLIYHIYHV